MCFSAELQTSVPGQPAVNDIVLAVLKECRKENLKYKMVALRCAAGVLQATKEDRFQELADIIFPMIKKVTVQLLELFPLSKQNIQVVVVWLMLDTCQASAQMAADVRNSPCSATSLVGLNTSTLVSPVEAVPELPRF